jgi:hypothetical protein
MVAFQCGHELACSVPRWQRSAKLSTPSQWQWLEEVLAEVTLLQGLAGSPARA